jgi:hypothetical protein
VALLPYFPMVVPLAGILICLALRSGAGRPVPWRTLYAATMALTGLSLIGPWLYSATGVPVVADPGYMAMPATPLWTPLGFWAAVVLVVVLLLGLLADLDRPVTKGHCITFLTFMAATMATVSAGNLVSLILAWSLPVWLILYLRASQVEVETRDVSRWDTWISLGSLCLIVLGAVAAAREQNGVLLLVELRPSVALAALSLAAAMRLLSWSLASGRGRWWQLHVMSLTTGFFLWLRLGIALNAEGPLAAQPGVAVAAVVALGLLIGPQDDRTGVIPGGFGYWLALSLAAPLLDPGRGFATTLLIATQLGLCLLILHGQPAARDGASLARLPRWVALGALGGMPLTSGFVVHWLFAQACLRTGGPLLLVVASLGFLMVAIPFWRRLMTREQPEAAAPGQGRYGVLVMAASAVPALLLVVLGLWPGLLAWIWPNIRLGLDAYGIGRQWSGGVPQNLALVVATLVVPVVGGYLLSARAGQLVDTGREAVGRTRQGARSGTGYLLAEQALDRVLSGIRRGLENIEEALPIGWTVLWGMALYYYLIVR